MRSNGADEGEKADRVQAGSCSLLIEVGFHSKLKTNNSTIAYTYVLCTYYVQVLF